MLEYKGKSINKKHWIDLSDEELVYFKESIFSYYRRAGFPYFETSPTYRQKEYNKLLKYHFTKLFDAKTKIVKQVMHGLALCWSYHPHNYKVKCYDLRSPYETFIDDDLFRQVIDKRMKYGDYVSDSGIRKTLKIFTGTQGVSNFRPTASACIYSLFTNENDTVLDMSAGYGGRLLGAHLAKV